MTATIFGVGDRAIVGWATETTPGTPVTASAYVPIEIGTATFDFDANRSAVEVAMGSVFVSIAIVDRKGKGTWSIKMEVYPTLGQDFITACGLTSSGIVPPSSLTLTVDYGGKALQYPGCRATKMVFDSAADKDLTVTISGEFTGRPVVIAPLAAPSVSGEDPFIWVDLGQITLLSGAATVSDCESFQLTVDMPHAAGYGNQGVPLPSILVLNKVNVSGKLSLFFNDTNYAEYNDYIIAGGVAGAIIVPFSKTVGGVTKTLTFDILNAKYSKGPVTAPKDGLDLIALDLMAFSPDLTNYFTYTIT